MTAATALCELDLEHDSLSDEELKALQELCRRRLTCGVAGHLEHLHNDKGKAYAEIRSEPEGETVFRVWRLGGTYALAYNSPIYGIRILAQSLAFPEVLDALPQWPPNGLGAAGGIEIGQGVGD